MRTLKLTLAYDGTRYAGWQIQPTSPTVQGVLQQTLCKITCEEIQTIGSSRTDAGVHALGQVVSFATATHLTNAVLRRALNAELPEDIVVLAIQDAPSSFNARHDAVSKRYRYHLYDGSLKNVFHRRYCWQLRTRLDEAAMHRAGQGLLGKHDFSSFESSGSPRASSVRTLTELTVRRGAGEGGGQSSESAAGQGGAESRGLWPVSGPWLGFRADEVSIDVVADGFLYNMVRAIVGTLVQVGRGARDESWPAQVLAGADRSLAGPTAPPEGLFLIHVEYPSSVASQPAAAGQDSSRD